MALIYQEIDRTISAGAFAEINIPFSHILILSTTAPQGSLQGEFISSESGGKQELTAMRAGIGIPMADGARSTVRLWNLSSSEIDVEVAISDVDIVDARTTISGALSVKGGNSRYTPATMTVSTTPVELYPENTNRTLLSIDNDGDFPLKVGDSNISTTQGRNVPVGGSYSTQCGASLWCVSVGGTNSGINTEEEGV